ncbi:hypothetical protein EH196_20235 [Bacillus sp. C1-1]|nr:hypothetical protein EH196_20235 [Bacillus sp. C1-1]
MVKYFRKSGYDDHLKIHVLLLHFLLTLSLSLAFHQSILSGPITLQMTLASILTLGGISIYQYIKRYGIDKIVDLNN